MGLHIILPFCMSLSCGDASASIGESSKLIVLFIIYSIVISCVSQFSSVEVFRLNLWVYFYFRNWRIKITKRILLYFGDDSSSNSLDSLMKGTLLFVLKRICLFNIPLDHCNSPVVVARVLFFTGQKSFISPSSKTFSSTPLICMNVSKKHVIKLFLLIVSG